MFKQNFIRAARRPNAEAAVNLAQRREWFVQDERGFQFLTDFDPVLSEIFYLKYRQIQPMLVGNIFGVRESTKSKETSQRVGSFGDPQPWEGQVHYDSAEPDYEIEWRHDHLTLGFKVEQTLLEDMQYSGIFDQAGNMGQAFNRKVVKDEASVFNNAFTAGATVGYDAVALCSNSHPRSKSDATAVDNYLGTLALTEANLETAIVQLEGLGDDRGEETAAMATHLVVGRQNRQKALQLTGSPLNPESANNAINTNMGLTPIVHPMITGKKWFVVDGPAAEMQMLWYWRLRAMFGADQDTSSTLMRSYFGRMRYSFGWQDFRWVVGSNPS
ncbi:MAG: Mu-like prophage major head subunit gpT family protein [Anaerolineae bacterium]|nr:Mu-like prophage major head subunit gpT family protein [Anaerolineae bacterium]